MTYHLILGALEEMALSLGGQNRDTERTQEHNMHIFHLSFPAFMQ